MDGKADMEADIRQVIDDGEALSLMEPVKLAEGCRDRGALVELAVELAARSAGLRRSLADSIVSALAELVRSMNCYYSNLIEPKTAVKVG